MVQLRLVVRVTEWDSAVSGMVVAAQERLQGNNSDERLKQRAARTPYITESYSQRATKNSTRYYHKSIFSV